MKRLLIADSSAPFTGALVDAFSHEFETRVCEDGETALELLLSFRPDYLIINLQLPFKDGLTVLQEAAYCPQVILATTSYLNSYVEQTAARLGVGYTMISPAINALRVRLMDMISQAQSENGDPDIVSKTTVYLHLLNFPTHLDGYRQLCTAIPLFYADPHQRLTKELYPEVARVCGSKDGRSVEHSIRKVIKTAWENRNPIVWANYLPSNAQENSSCPTNKAFISRLSELLHSK